MHMPSGSETAERKMSNGEEKSINAKYKFSYRNVITIYFFFDGCHQALSVNEYGLTFEFNNETLS